MNKQRFKPVTCRDGHEVKAPRGITAAQLQLMHDAFWGTITGVPTGATADKVVESVH